MEYPLRFKSFWKLYLISDVQRERGFGKFTKIVIRVIRHNEPCQQLSYTMKSIQRWSTLILHLHIWKYSRERNGSLIVSISPQIIIKRNNIAVKSASLKSAAVRRRQHWQICSPPDDPSLQALFHLFAFVKRGVDYVNSSIHRAASACGIYIVMSSIQAR